MIPEHLKNLKKNVDGLSKIIFVLVEKYILEEFRRF